MGVLKGGYMVEDAGHLDNYLGLALADLYQEAKNGRVYV